MRKEEYLYHVVKTVFSVMVQSTIAIENFFDVTIDDFNKSLLSRYYRWNNYYDRALQLYINDEGMGDAVLIQYLRKYREESIKKALEYIDVHVVKKANVAYDIKDKFFTYENDRKINNPFEQIISDLRELAEKKHIEKEVSSLSVSDVVWYDSEELKLIRSNRRSTGNTDGELGGHLMQKKVSNDTSYLVSDEEAEQLFSKMVLGVVPVD